MKISFGKRAKGYGAKLRLYFLVLAIFTAVMQPQPAHAQLGVDPVQAAHWVVEHIYEVAEDIIKVTLSSIGNVMQAMVAKINSIASDIRTTFLADSHRQDSENAVEADKVAKATLPTDSNGNFTTSACATHVKIFWVREVAASAVTGLNARLGGLEATKGTGQNGQEQTPAVAAEKDCALSGQAWTLVKATRNGHVPKSCPQQ